MEGSITPVLWLTWLWKTTPGIAQRGSRVCGIFMKDIPVVPASVTRCLWIRPSNGSLPRESERGIFWRQKERWREINGKEEIELCSIHLCIRFIVDIIDVSIRVVITVGGCEMFLIIFWYCQLCISRSRNESTKMGNKEETHKKLWW